VTPCRILFFAFRGVFGAVGEDLLADPDRGRLVLARLSEECIVFGGYTVYDYVLRARVGRTLGKKVLKIRLVPYTCVTSVRTGVMKRAAPRPDVLPMEGIPVMKPLAAISGSLARRCSSRRAAPFSRDFVAGSRWRGGAEAARHWYYGDDDDHLIVPLVFPHGFTTTTGKRAGEKH